MFQATRPSIVFPEFNIVKMYGVMLYQFQENEFSVVMNPAEIRGFVRAPPIVRLTGKNATCLNM